MTDDAGNGGQSGDPPTDPDEGEGPTPDPPRSDPRDGSPDDTDDGERAGDDAPDAVSDPAPGVRGSLLDRLPFDVPRSRAFQVVVALTVLSLLVRLVALGGRTAHWDEGRVAFWTLRYADTGFFEYRPIVHGPFLFQVDSTLFSLFGASDFVARLPVALVGGLLPAAAWLFRDRLRSSEVVALALVLAGNPLLVYYSRFMRNDVLVAGFALFALGFLVRGYDTRRPAYLYAGSASLALGFTAKENALLYVLCWLGGLALLLDHRLVGAVRDVDRRAAWSGDRIRDRVRSGVTTGRVAALVFLVANPAVAGLLGVSSRGPVAVASLSVIALGSYFALLDGDNPWHYAAALPFAATLAWLSFGASGVQMAFGHAMAWLLAGGILLDRRLFGATGTGTESTTSEGAVATDGGPIRGFRDLFPPSVGAYLLFFGVLVLFYAPRAGDAGDIGLWRSFLHPTEFPTVIEEALLGSWLEVVSTWIEPHADGGPYSDRLELLARTMVAGAGVVALFSLVGFLADRWSDGPPRDLVSLGAYWGTASFLGYPYATDIWAPWLSVHVIVPLAIPAAVGIALVYRWGREALDGGDVLTAVLVGVLLVTLAMPAAITVVDASYLNSDSHERVVTDLVGGDNEQRQLMIQWAQPGNDLKSTLGTVDRIAASNEGVDVTYYAHGGSDGSTEFYVPDDDRCLHNPPAHEPSEACSEDPGVLSWHSRLPLPWYFEAYGADVDSVHPDDTLADAYPDGDLPPVVVGVRDDRDEIATQLPDRYDANVHRFKLWGEDVVIFVDRTAVPGS